MSRAGAAERGFTLLELLVALTIVALGAMLALPRLEGLLRPDLDRTAQRVALAIRDSRTSAMRTGRPVAVTPERLAPVLPAGVTIAANGFEETGLLFFPIGTSSGGTIMLATADQRRAVHVDWLTGRVTVERVP